MAKQTIPVRNGYVKHRPETERRASVRLPKDHEAWCQPTTTSRSDVLDTAWLGRVRDVSTAGIGLSMTRRFEPGTAWACWLGHCNFGERHQLLIAGVPVGREIPLKKPRAREKGSIIVVIATDAPLLPHQLKRLAKRASHGLARTGSVSGNGSGDIFIAFSTANAKAFKDSRRVRATLLANEEMDPLFEATAQATEEAIINALASLPGSRRISPPAFRKEETY